MTKIELFSVVTYCDVVRAVRCYGVTDADMTKEAQSMFGAGDGSNLYEAYQLRLAYESVLAKRAAEKEAQLASTLLAFETTGLTVLEYMKYYRPEAMKRWQAGSENIVDRMILQALESPGSLKEGLRAPKPGDPVTVGCKKWPKADIDKVVEEASNLIEELHLMELVRKRDTEKRRLNEIRSAKKKLSKP